MRQSVEHSKVREVFSMNHESRVSSLSKLDADGCICTERGVVN